MAFSMNLTYLTSCQNIYHLTTATYVFVLLISSHFGYDIDVICTITMLNSLVFVSFKEHVGVVIMNTSDPRVLNTDTSTKDFGGV